MFFYKHNVYKHIQAQIMYYVCIMIFAVGREINVVTFKIKTSDIVEGQRNYKSKIKKKIRKKCPSMASYFDPSSYPELLAYTQTYMFTKLGWNCIFVTAGHPVKNYSEIRFIVKFVPLFVSNRFKIV